MAPATPDDGFHEIQLNGKQLVFLFMAATVVSVVIFLCGVLVGRGVRAERGGTSEAAVVSDAPAADITPTQPPASATPMPANADPTIAVPPPPAEDLTYFKRLEDPKQPQEDIKAASAKAAAQAAASGAKASAPPPAANAKNSTPAAKQTAKNSPSTSAPAAKPADAGGSSDLQPPAAQGYAVQIAALNVRSEAEAIAKHLAAKGYAAYVASHGSPAVYRVRVGTFKTRREADTVAAKLEKDEQVKGFVTK